MSLGARAVLAVALFFGFYALALGLALTLALFPLVEVLAIERLHIKVALLFWFGAGTIVWSILPRWDRFEAPGPVLRPEKHPALFEQIEAVAKATGQAPPVDVYLVADVNAFVTERGGILGFGRRRVMGLGLPLLQVLTVPELRAVLAHEFGHFHGGDTALGPWIYKTRAAMGRTVQNLGNSGIGVLQLMSLPFQWYGALFLRLTFAISRAQERAADALAARVECSPPDTARRSPRGSLLSSAVPRSPSRSRSTWTRPWSLERRIPTIRIPPSRSGSRCWPASRSGRSPPTSGLPPRSSATSTKPRPSCCAA